jgi:hypothetical protein
LSASSAKRSLFDMAAIRQQVGVKVHDRGEAYFHDDAVTLLGIGSGTFKAPVAGTSRLRHPSPAMRPERFLWCDHRQQSGGLEKLIVDNRQFHGNIQALAGQGGTWIGANPDLKLTATHGRPE